MRMAEISVVIPCYNEEDKISSTIKTIDDFLTKNKISGEIIVVDDGSNDRTSEIARNTPTANLLKVITYRPNRGKGFAVKKGMLASTGNFILFTDADLSTPIEEFNKLFPFVKQGYDVVISSRALPSSRLFPPQPFYRRFIGYICRMIVRALLLPEIKDTQCGFKLFTRKAVDEILPFMETKGFAFDIEMLAIAKKKNLKIKEVGVFWRNNPFSKVNVFRDTIKTFLEVIKISRSPSTNLDRLKDI